MNCMTKSQLRFAYNSGVIQNTVVKSAGEVFNIIVQTNNGKEATVISSRTKTPRTFASPANALSFLFYAGVTEGQFDLHDWTPRIPERTLPPVQTESEIQKLFKLSTQEIKRHPMFATKH